MTTGTVDRALSLRGAARAVLECRDPEVLIAGPAHNKWYDLGVPRPRKDCIGPECDRKANSHLLCHGHLQQRDRGKPLTVLRERWRSVARDDLGRKRCRTCREWKPVDAFYPKPGATDALAGYCARCDRNMRLQRQYGITVDQFDAMLVRQNGGCAICERTQIATLHVDHDHACCPTRKKSCGKCLRGLLCEDCNRALGMFQDSPRLLVAAMSYLT